MPKRKTRYERPETAKHNSPSHVTEVWDLQALDAWSARQSISCPRCGERLDPTQPEGIFVHLLLHDWPPEKRAWLEQKLAILSNWDNLPVEIQRALIAPTIVQMRNDPGQFEELQRAGVVAPVRKG